MNNDEKAKRLSVERIYQKKTQLEHILLRPDTYVGSIEETTKQMWIFDEGSEAIVCKNITFVPGLYKIFDEILGLLFVACFLFIKCGEPDYLVCIVYLMYWYNENRGNNLI